MPWNARSTHWPAPPHPTDGLVRCRWPDYREDRRRDRQHHRFRSEACFAMHAGVAPIPASSGRTQRHRLARGGNRQLNAALHRIAITQVRLTDSPGQLYYQRRRAQGDTAMEALRALKGRLARVVFNLLQADTTVAINDLSTAA